MARVNIVGDFKESGLKKRDLVETVEAVFDFLGNEKNTNVAIVSPKEIQKLNMNYRKADKPTDVLSFNYEDEGDVLLCIDLIGEMKETDESLSEAVQKTLIHGALHLFCYDHENKEDRAIMNEIENKVWRKLSK